MSSYRETHFDEDGAEVCTDHGTLMPCRHCAWDDGYATEPKRKAGHAPGHVETYVIHHDDGTWYRDPSRWTWYCTGGACGDADERTRATAPSTRCRTGRTPWRGWRRTSARSTPASPR